MSRKTRAQKDAAARRRLTIFRSKTNGTCYHCEGNISHGDLVAWVDGPKGVPRHYRCACHEVGLMYRVDGVTPI